MFGWKRNPYVDKWPLKRCTPKSLSAEWQWTSSVSSTPWIVRPFVILTDALQLTGSTQNSTRAITTISPQWIPCTWGSWQSFTSFHQEPIVCLLWDKGWVSKWPKKTSQKRQLCAIRSEALLWSYTYLYLEERRIGHETMNFYFGSIRVIMIHDSFNVWGVICELTHSSSTDCDTLFWAQIVTLLTI